MSSPPAQSTKPRSRLKQPGTLSQVTGAAVGTAIEAWAQVFGLSQTMTHALEISAPAIAVVIGATAHYFVEMLKYQINWYGLHYFLRRAKKRVAATTAGSGSHDEAQANVERLEGLINGLLVQGATTLRGLWQ